MTRMLVLRLAQQKKKTHRRNDDMGIRRYTQLKPNAQHIADFEIDRHSFQKLIITFIKRFFFSSITSYCMVLRTWSLIT